MFQGLNEQQKESIEKQWAEQKQQFMGRQKSTYEFRFRGLEPAPEPRSLRDSSGASRDVEVHVATLMGKKKFCLPLINITTIEWTLLWLFEN